MFLVNMADFLLMSKPLELSDFLLSLMSALALAVENETDLPALGRGYWEQLRGNGEDAAKVQQSVVELFNGQAASLALPRLHVVYTIPPYLQALSKNLGRLLAGHPIVSWPNVHVRSRTGRNDGSGLQVMQEIVERRFPGWQEIIPQRLLTHMAKASGGDLRDFFRLVRECPNMLSIARLNDPTAELTGEMVRRAEDALRNDFLPIAEADARWLARIHQSKQHLEWCDGFALIFVFSDRSEVSAIFRERLSAIHRARITGLMLETPQTPGDLLDRILPRLVRRRQLREALMATVWLDLSQARGTTWSAALEQFLALLNAQREPLRSALSQPLVLEFKTADKAKIRSLAPDLWAIRHLVMEAGAWLTGAPEESTPARPPPGARASRQRRAVRGAGMAAPARPRHRGPRGADCCGPGIHRVAAHRAARQCLGHCTLDG